MFVLGYHWLPLATIGLVGDNREFELVTYCEVLYPLWMVDNLGTLNMHHCLCLFTIGCP